tara:strand:+ start:7833 stop:8207 length:375 start_codon:yes stop_codon:yes gene_type:complete
MQEKRFVDLKNKMYQIRQKDMELSSKVDAKAYNNKELNYEQKTYKKLNYADLPIYRKWIVGDSIYYYRGRIVDGRLICDKIYVGKNTVEYSTTHLSSIMDQDNKEIEKEEFNNAICKLITYLEK